MSFLALQFPISPWQVTLFEATLKGYTESKETAKTALHSSLFDVQGCANAASAGCAGAAQVTFCYLVSRYFQGNKNKYLRFYLRYAFSLLMKYSC